MQKRLHESGIEPFDLFCVYHLGVSRSGERRFHNLHQVAHAFAVPPETIRAALEYYEMDPETVLSRQFDIAGAQADIAVLPDGQSPTEEARRVYAHYLESRGSERDWKGEIEAGQRENEDDPIYARRSRERGEE